jgi:crossover junction endodeoxyribonuclease RuvC
VIILGIDPGTAHTGFGVVKKIRDPKSKTQKGFRCLGYGLITTSPKLSAAARLNKLYNDLIKLIKNYKPDILAVENVYFFKNLKTAMPVSQAKGVILLTAAKKKIPVLEFTPLQMKMTICGYGKAEKQQIQKMIKYLLNLKDLPRPDDAADALGMAICGTLNDKK